MKNLLKISLVALLSAGVFTGCSDDDTRLPETAYASYSENFGTVTQTGDYTFSLDNWTVFAEAGSKNWFINDFEGNVYLEFSSFNSGNSSNIGWIVSPAINVDNAKLKRLVFQSAQHHATSLDNTFELFISTDFDGEDIVGAEWQKKTFRLPPFVADGGENYKFVNSGVIDLSAYSGEIYIAFKVKGNSTTQTGGFQIDNLNIF